jgi:LPS sulfotransferase NodH
MKINKHLLDFGWRGNKNYTHFIILGRSRTGSNLLRGLLNDHPNIVVLGELFQNQEEIGWAYPGYAQDSVELERFRNQPIEFLEQKVFRNFPSRISAVGFKIFYYHAQHNNWLPVWPYLRDQSNLHIIHIKRRNILKTHLSKLRADHTNIWVDTNGKNKTMKPFSVCLDFNECQNVFSQTRTWEKEYDLYFNGHPCLEIYYEDLAQNHSDEMKRVQNFLNVELRPVEPQTHKQSHRKLKDTIANYSEIKEQFSGTEWAPFFEE